jgi:hypothetical protein
MKKLFAVLFIVFALPVFGALASGSRHRAQAFNSVAVAGHTQFGGSCGCDEPGCICEPGDRAAVMPPSDGSGLMLLLFALALAARFASK